MRFNLFNTSCYTLISMIVGGSWSLHIQNLGFT